MQKENQQRLFSEFPQLYRDAKRHQSILSWGITCGNGWFPLLYELSREIEQVAEKANLQGDGYPRLAQAKEKMGSLRFYFRFGNEDAENENASPRSLAAEKQIQALAREAENKSMTICETCSKPGKLYKDGWWRVRCDRCEDEVKARQVIAESF